MINIDKTLSGIYHVTNDGTGEWIHDLSYLELEQLHQNISDLISDRLNEDLLSLMEGADDCEGGACKI